MTATTADIRYSGRYLDDQFRLALIASVLMTAVEHWEPETVEHEAVRVAADVLEAAGEYLRS